MKNTVIQFGEGNFLRAFVDSFIDILNKKGLYDGKIVIVKPTPRGNLSKFSGQNCKYNLVLRGIENGERVCDIFPIDCVSGCVNPYENFEGYLALAHNPDFRFVVSNTTEAGIVFDGNCKFSDRPALSFPGKLTQLLYERYKTGLGGFVLLPCELIDANADKLKNCILKYAKLWNLGEEFITWLETENSFCNTLVDRIVTGYPTDEAAEISKQIGFDDKLLDTAEPYHLWAIEGNFENELPLNKAGLNVIWSDDIKPVKKRKVRVLNGAHTIMAFPALLCSLETVKECLDDSDISAFLKHWLFNCTLPVIGESGENTAFANAVLERFANPFIKHQLTAIALNSVSKFSVRVLPTAIEYKEKFGSFPKCAALSLAALIKYYKTRQINDSAENIEFIKNSNIAEIVKSDIFNTDISAMLDDIQYAYSLIESGKIREGLLWAIS